MIGLLLSVMVPGLGHFYYGRPGTGAGLALMAITPLYPLALTLSLLDVYRLKRNGIRPIYDDRTALLALLIGVILLPLTVGLSVVSLGTAVSWYQAEYLYPEATAQEVHEIARELEEVRLHAGRYPRALEELTRGRPLRQDWLVDGWGRPYSYEVTANGDRFWLRSAGKDGTLGTEDDYAFKGTAPEQPLK